MSRYNSVVYSSDRYFGSEKEKEEELWNSVRDQLKLLLNSGYIATVRLDETNIVVIDYNYDDESFGSPMPYWLYPEEEESLNLE